MESPQRRAALRRVLQLASGALALPLAVSAGAAQSCGDPESEPLRDSLHYGPAPATTRSCATCSFFTGDSSGSCGACMIMGGPVDRGSHCDSWATHG